MISCAPWDAVERRVYRMALRVMSTMLCIQTKTNQVLLFSSSPIVCVRGASARLSFVHNRLGRERRFTQGMDEGAMRCVSPADL